MAEYLSSELWYCIARNNFDVWCVLIRTVATFWRYVKKIDAGRSISIVEKLFGNIRIIDADIIQWRIGKYNYRLRELPYIMQNAAMKWYYRRSNGKPICMDISGYTRWVWGIIYDTGLGVFKRQKYICKFSPSSNVREYYEFISFNENRVSYLYSRNRHCLNVISCEGNGYISYRHEYSPRTNRLPNVICYNGEYFCFY